MRKFLIAAFMLISCLSSAFAQEEVVFTILKTDGNTIDFVMNREARIYYSDTQLMFYDGNDIVSVNFEDIRKAYFTAHQDVEEIDNQQLTFYPNPVNDVLSIKNIADNQTITVYSISGQVMIQLVASGEATVDVSKLQNGIYLISAGNMVSKFVKM